MQVKQMKSERLILAGYLLGFLILAMTLAIFQPIKNAPPIYANPPDEHARYMIPQYICEHGVIPTGLEEEIRIESYGFSYGLYNTFPYIIQGYLMRFVKLFTSSGLALLYTARMVNVFFGLLMAGVIYLISKRVFSDRRFGWLFCFSIMYLPECLFMHTYVNTDSCCLLATSMMVYALVSAYREGFTTRNCLWMSGGIILCALSYYNAYGYILSCILLFLAYFVKSVEGKIRYDLKPMLQKGIFVSVLVLLGIGWWFVRQYIVLNGDFLGLATRKEMAIQYAADNVNPLYNVSYRDKGYSLWQMIAENHTFDLVFRSFVAAFGSMSMYSTELLYLGYKVLFAVAAVGMVILAAERLPGLKGKKLFFHMNMWFCILMPMILMLYYSYTTDYQPQGRYIMPAVVPFMYYVIKGLERLAGLHIRKKTMPRWLVTGAIVFCFLLIIGGTAEMIYHRCLPIYLEAGIALP